MLKAILFNDTTVDAHHGCTRVVTAIESLCGQNGIVIAARVLAHTDWTSNAAVRSQMAKVDLVLVNGEGTLHGSKPQIGWLLAAGVEARRLKKPAFLINTCWFNVDKRFHDDLRSFDLIACRDSHSHSEVLRIHGNARVMGDLSLYLPNPPASVRKADLVVSDSVIRDVAVSLNEYSVRHKGDFLPAVFRPEGFVNGLRFYRAIFGKQDLKAGLDWILQLHRLRRAQSLSAVTDADEFIGRLQSGKAVLSGRFHVCTLALVAGTPFAAIESNTPKISGLLSDAGLSSLRLINASELQRSQPVVIAPWSETEAENIRSYLEQTRNSANALFAEIRQVALRKQS